MSTDHAEGRRHAHHYRMKKKHKTRDRIHGKFWKGARWIFARRFEKDYTFNRRKVPTETGYGVAYERRNDV